MPSLLLSSSSLVLLLLLPSLVALPQLQFLQNSDITTASFPIFHRTPANLTPPQPQRRLASLHLDAQNSSSPPPLPSDLRSQLISLNEPFGQYFALLQLGSPAKEIAVIIDTGSELLWVQCEPCSQCGKQIRDPIFDPAKSSSYSALSCDVCIGDASVAVSCSTANQCVYAVTYGDSSNSTGFLSSETLTIPTAKGSSFQLTETVFGCGFTNTGVESSLNASGLMGLDRGNFSIPTQLGVYVFSYCLPDRVHNVQATGYLTFGKSSSSPASPNLQYTPLIQNQFSPFLSQFYYLNMIGVSVNGNLLDIPTSAFEIVSGDGGTVIDSGTTLTSFVDVAYIAVADAFDAAVDPSVRRAKVAEDSTDLCYQVPLSQQNAPTAPKVTLHFAGPVDIDLQPDHVFRFLGYDSTYNYYCMAFSNAGKGSGAKNFFGNYQQQNFLVEYDVGNSRVGFAPTQCSHGNSFSSWQSPTRLVWIFPTLLLILTL